VNETWLTEEHLLGAVLVSPALLGMVLAETGLRSEHFERTWHRELFAAMCALNDAGVAPDVLAVADRLPGQSERLAALASHCPAPGAAAHYARIVVQAATWRQRERAVTALRQAIAERNEGAFGDARGELDHKVRGEDAYLSPDDLAHMAYGVMDGGGKEAFPWPFHRLNVLGAGGYRRGQLVVISGHTHFGKSVWLDQCLDVATNAGARACLYMNEMDPEERIGGILQRRAGVPFERFIQGKPNERDRSKAVKLLNHGLAGWGITPIAGWSAREVAAHIRLHRWDVAAVDILHRFPHREERDIAEIVEIFAETAKLAECALLLVAHVNRNRVQSGVRPQPTRGDLRGSGSIENDADVVCFVHRDQHPETFEPLPESRIYFDKYRGGQLGGLSAHFNASRLRFEPVEPEGRSAERPELREVIA